MEKFPEQLLGTLAPRFVRFPLLVEVPSTPTTCSRSRYIHRTARRTTFRGRDRKTEAWVVLKAGPESLISPASKTGTTAESLQLDLTDKALAGHLPCFTPKPGTQSSCLRDGSRSGRRRRGVRDPAEQRRDVPLYDWDHVDEKDRQSFEPSRSIRPSPVSILPKVHSVRYAGRGGDHADGARAALRM